MKDEILNEIIGPPVDTEVAFDALMPRKVSNLLLVSSLYDYYTFIEDGTISEMLYSEFLDLDLRFTPSIQRETVMPGLFIMPGAYCFFSHSRTSGKKKRIYLPIISRGMVPGPVCLVLE